MTALLLALALPLAAQDFDHRSKPQPLDLPSAPAAEAGVPAQPVQTKADAPRNVILITWDGVRSEDFFGNKPDPLLEKADTAPLLPIFWGQRAAEGMVWGTPGAAGSFRIANLAAVSLPAYQSIMAGYAQPCLNNNCGRITVETLPERLVREGFAKDKVVVIAGWNGVTLAAEHRQGTATVDGPSSGSRPDPVTWAAAMKALATQPRFLYIALNDSDDFGHAGDYPNYMGRLRLYDQYLDALIKTLAGMGDYGANTTILMTTDHGRGLGQDWKNHNILRPTASKIWLYARGPGVAKGLGPSGRNHLDLRPTIEKLLGLAPYACADCGSPIPEIAP